jgi:DNA polymerase-3 subunit delta
MKLAPEKLTRLLEKNIPGFYFCSGNDTFLVNEMADKIIAAAKQLGFNEVSHLYVDSGFSWEKLYETIHTPSIFSPKIAVVIQLSSWKLDDKAKALLTESSQHNTDYLLVIVKGPKLERAMSNTKWFQAMTEHSYWIEIPAMYPSQVPEWLQQRATQYDFKLTREQAQQLAQRTENNLPSAAQAIEKLQLLNLPITNALIENMVEVSAEYDTFKLIDACLAGDSVRSYQIFFSLKNNATEPLIIIGSLARELRLIREITQAQSENISLKSACQRLGIWESRLPLIQNFIRTYSYHQCQQMLAQLATFDAIAKGALPGNVWNELFGFCMKIANKSAFLTAQTDSLIG